MIDLVDVAASAARIALGCALGSIIVVAAYAIRERRRL